jgi:hypothetical protein
VVYGQLNDAFTAPPPYNLSTTRSVRGCHPCLRYAVLPICPGRTIRVLERAKGFEPSTPTLARSCSTTELHPHPRGWRRWLAGNGQSYAKCGRRMQQPARDLRIGSHNRLSELIWRNCLQMARKRPLSFRCRRFRWELGGLAAQYVAQRFEPFPEPALQRAGQFVVAGRIAIEGAPPFNERPIAIDHRRDTQGRLKTRDRERRHAAEFIGLRPRCCDRPLPSLSSFPGYDYRATMGCKTPASHPISDFMAIAGTD